MSLALLFLPQFTIEKLPLFQILLIFALTELCWEGSVLLAPAWISRPADAGIFHSMSTILLSKVLPVVWQLHSRETSKQSSQKSIIANEPTDKFGYVTQVNSKVSEKDMFMGPEWKKTAQGSPP